MPSLPGLTPEDRSSLHRLAVVLHVRHAGAELTDAVRELAAAGFAGIVVVDDGSASAWGEISRIESVRLCGHAIPLGRSAAFRTGINEAIYRWPEITGVVTAAATDRPADIVQIALAAVRRSDAMILGARPAGAPGFTRNASRLTMRWLAGAEVTDASSSLRAIPVAFAKELLERDAPGNEFELDALLAARYEAVPIIEEAIEGDAAPVTNPLASLRAWMALLRFGSVSLATVVIDNLVFYLALRRGASILTAQIIARTLAGLFAYFAVRRAVFRSDSHHAIAAPRYVALVATSGAFSYLLIRLILSATGGRVTVIKIAVEGLLFFANFAIQRDWIFLRPKEAAAPSRPPLPRALSALLWLLLLAPLALEYYGFRATDLMKQLRWLPDGEIHFRNYTLWYTLAAFAGLFARRWFVPVLFLGIIVCTIFAVGFAPPAAALLFVFSATVLGRLTLGKDIEGPLAFLGGTCLWIAAMYFTATLPIHYPGVHFAALLLPLAIGHRQTHRLASRWHGLFEPAWLPGPAEYAAFAGLAFVLVANWLVVLKPEVSTDGLAMHLNIPANMAIHHAYTVDFHQFIWALMPIGGDFCYAVLYSLGGEYAARLFNFAILISLAALLFTGARMFLSRPLALLIAMLFVSTPMVYFVTGSLFVENIVAAMVLGGLIALWRFHQTHSRRYLMLCAVLFGTSIALKLGAVAAGVIGLGYLVWEVWKSRRGTNPVARRAAFAAVAVVSFLGSIPYAKAWHLTGNPLFPFETAMFKSPLVKGRDIQDLRYVHPLTWHTPFDLTFHTTAYFEGQPGSLGFQYLLFLPLILAGCFVVRSFEGRSAIVIGGISALVIAGTQPNARYFYFALPPLTLGLAAVLAWVRDREPLFYRAALAAVLAAVYVNVWFLPSADWYHRSFYSAPLFSAAGRTAYMRDKGGEGPVREVIAWINQHNTTKPVVFTDGSTTAGLIAPVYTNNWHDYSFTMQVQAAPLPYDVYLLFAHYGINEMVVDRRHTDRQDAVTKLISACGITEFSAEPFAAMKLRPDCDAVLAREHPINFTCSPGAPLPPGSYDETDPRIVFAGNWTKARQFAEPWQHTITYSNVPGSVACFAIEGTSFDYIYSGAFNRGRAAILVDGEQKDKVDLYSPKIEWQSHHTIGGLKPGRHVITIRGLPEKSTAATDFFIDVDRIIVH